MAIASAAALTRRSRIKKAAIVLVVTGLIASVAFAARVVSLGPLPLVQARQVSTTVIDRNGKLLRAYAMADGRWRLPVDAKKDVDPTYLNLLLAYEDQRFRTHAGVDPLALARAAYQLVTRGHIVSGGSTITMQLARLMEEPGHHRSFSAKLHQIVRAIEIERQLSKDDILNLYLALAPFGGNLEGNPRRPPSPISARSESGCRWRKPPSWWRCSRNRWKPAGLDRYPQRRARRARPRARPHDRRASRHAREDAAQAKTARGPNCQADALILAARHRPTGRRSRP